MRRRGALRHEGRCARPLSEQVVPRFPSAMGDESLGDYNAVFPCADEALPADEGFVTRMRSGDRHIIRWIAATNFPQPCQSGSAVGIPDFFFYVRTVASTSSPVIFSFLIPVPITLPPPVQPVKNWNPSCPLPTGR